MTIEEKTKVLVVDDSLFFRQMLPKKLSSEKFVFEIAKDGLAAWEKIVEHSDIELIISDMEMPVMNGLQLIRKIRGEGIDTPLIIMTASDQVTVAIEAMNLGAGDYLLKDENILKMLPISVNKILEKHQLKKRNCQLLLDLATKNRELEKSNRELRDLNELKNKFLGIAAHDLRSPLSSIRGLSEFLSNEIFGPLTDEQKEYLNIIHATSNEMLTMVNDLLDVSVIERGKLEIKPEKGSLKKLIENRIKINRIAADKKKIQIEFEHGELPEIEFDSPRIAQVIDNLISNAVKYSPPGSKIGVFAEIDGNAAKVRIRDEGPGISNDEQTCLFGEFQKLSAKPTAGEKSTGLGLAIVKKIIDAHGGALEVESGLGQGSVFSFEIPRDKTVSLERKPKSLTGGYYEREKKTDGPSCGR